MRRARASRLSVGAGSVEACRDADAILARLGVVTRTRHRACAPKLRIVARHGVGVDAVDLDAATERGVVVTTTGSENAAAVAEYTFALLLALVRHVVAADAGMRAGQWDRDPLVGAELDGATMGVIGYGAIGRRVARQAMGFGMRVLAHDVASPRRNPASRSSRSTSSSRNPTSSRCTRG